MTFGTGAYALLGLTALVAGLVSVLVFALLRFLSAARAARTRSQGGTEMARLSSVLEHAVAQLRERERATAARAEASERLSGEIIASLTAGLLVVDTASHIRILNPAGRRMLGFDEREQIDDLQLLPEELLRMIEQCLATRASIRRRTLQVKRPRGVIHLGVTVSALTGPDSELRGAVCLFTDLTAVKDLEEQLRLKDSLAAVGELTAGIAHEFRNGLATIQGYSRLIRPDDLPAAYRPYVAGIRAETEAMTEVVTNFLQFARPERLTLTRVDLRAVCDRAADELRGEARALGGDIELRGPFGAVDGDEVLLRQAFSNLLRNAVEACAGAAVAPVIVIESAVDTARQRTRVAINDSGPGIEPSERERVFRPFYTSKRNGTGLGLALVQKIVVFHNGRIALDAAPQGGASVQITLPLASA